MADLTTDIETAATKPKQAEADGVKVQARTLDELIAADKYLKQASSNAAGRRLGGIRLGQFRSSGSTGST